MDDHVFIERLATAYKTVRADLLAAAESSGHWVGELSSSALSTATAISALAVYEQNVNVAEIGDSEQDPKIERCNQQDYLAFEHL